MCEKKTRDIEVIFNEIKDKLYEERQDAIFMKESSDGPNELDKEKNKLSNELSDFLRQKLTDEDYSTYTKKSANITDAMFNIQDYWQKIYYLARIKRWFKMVKL